MKYLLLLVLLFIFSSCKLRQQNRALRETNKEWVRCFIEEHKKVDSLKKLLRQ